MKSSCQKSNEKRVSLLLISCLLIFFLFLAGCGGGTVGSGDVETKIIGTLVNTEGKPIKAAVVTDSESGESTTTDAAGKFVLDATPVKGSVSMIIEKESLSLVAEIKKIESEALEVNVAITIDEVSGIVDSVTILTSSGEEPTPPNQLNLQMVNAEVRGSNNKTISGVVLSIANEDYSRASNTKGKVTLTRRSNSSSMRINVKYKNLSGSFNLSGLPTDRDSTIECVISLAIVSSQPDPGSPDKPTLELTVDEVRVR